MIMLGFRRFQSTRHLMQRAQQRLREDGRQPVGQLATAGGEAGQAVALSFSALSADDARNQGEPTGRCPRTDGDVTRNQSSEALDLSSSRKSIGNATLSTESKCESVTINESSVA
ncbi:hypothetical protein GS892_24650 [Rhodococcus hoagii]|nr:hypothetical protein [Prescottella equi]